MEKYNFTKKNMREVAKEVKNIFKKNKGKDYYELYVCYDMRIREFYVSEKYDEIDFYCTVVYYKIDGIKTIDKYIKEIFG